MKKVFVIVKICQDMDGNSYTQNINKAFLNKEKAKQFCYESNKKVLQKKERDFVVYEKNWGEDFWDKNSEDGKLLTDLYEKDDFDSPLWDEINEKHKLRNENLLNNIFTVNQEELKDFYIYEEINLIS